MNKLFATAALLALTPVAAWAVREGCGVSPLLIDVKGDGIQLGPKGAGVHFDLKADGTPDHLQWVRVNGDEGFLVADLNGNGRVDDGSELFGEGTTLILTGEKARNGYIALAQYDTLEFGGNDDGLISNADTIWPKLRIWIDANADGKTQRGELTKPQALGLVSFGTIPKFQSDMDEAGNRMPMYSWVTTVKRKKLKMVDVFFRELP